MKAIVLLGAVIGVIFFLLREPMPSQDLREYKSRSYGRTTKTIGGSCSVETCLVIYVAPWCPHCRKATPMIKQLTQELRADGIEVNIVVGRDSDSAVEKYALSFPLS